MPRRRQLVMIVIQLPLSFALFAAAAHAEDRPVRHPFRGVELVDGRIPLLDVKDSPAGRRYAVVDQGGQLAEDAP